MSTSKSKVAVTVLKEHRCSECGELHDPTPRIYREAEFRIIAPHDLSGKPMTYQSFQAPPKYMRLLEMMWCDPRTPWKTYSDVMRAALDYFCTNFAPALGGTIILGIIHSLGMMNRLIDQAREANDFAQSIDQLEREVKRMIDSEMRESAVGLVYQYREQAKGMPDRILRRRLVGDINQRFGYLLKGDQGRKEHERGGAKIAVDHDHVEEPHQHSEDDDQ